MNIENKTLLVCAANKVANHVGEVYTDFIQVENVPNTTSVNIMLDRIRGRIRKIATENDNAPVEVFLDGPMVYESVLLQLRLIMPADENITVIYNEVN